MDRIPVRLISMWKISGPCASLGTMQSAPVHKPGPTNWQILTSPRGASMMFAVRGKWVRINLPAKVQRSRMSAASFAPVMFLVTTFKPLFQAISTAGPCKVVAIRQTHQMMMNIGSGLQVASIASGARAQTLDWIKAHASKQTSNFLWITLIRTCTAVDSRPVRAPGSR